MDWNALLTTIVTAVVLPLLTILSNYLIKFIEAKIESVKVVTSNETKQKYLDLAEKTLTSCIQATTQTFVSNAKKTGEFNSDTALQAFQLSKETFLKTISTEVEETIKESYGDVDAWIEVAIESILADLKQKES